jgi:hypothetical protein
VFGQHSADSAISCLCVRVSYEYSRGGFIVGFGGQCCRFQGSNYLLRAVSIILANGGEKFKSLARESWSQGDLALCIREARTDCLLAGW